MRNTDNNDVKKRVRSPLVVDPDVDFLNTIRNSTHPSQIKAVCASQGRDAQLLLSDQDQSFSALFVNPSISNPGGISVIRCARLNRPAMPVFIIHNDAPPFTEKELKELGVQKMLQKPVTFEQMMGMTTPSPFVFDLKWAESHSQTDKEHALNAAVSAEDSKFVPIRAADFLSGTVSFFDVYVRLNANKYVKILQAGDKFQVERVKSYGAKGVTLFYIKKEAQEQYLSYCDQLSSRLLASQSARVDIKASQVMNHGEETLKFLQSHGISEVNIQYASRFLSNTQKLVTQLNPGKQPLLKGFLNDVLAYDHGVGVTLISSLLIPALKISSFGPVETIGLASLFHDIGLHQLSLSTEDTGKMTDETIQKFRTHPEVGSEVLRSIHGIKPATVQAVLQHHERRNKKGFPHQLGTGSITLIAEMIGISDEFLNLIQRLKKGEKFNLAQEMKENIFDGFSPKLVTEFKKVFLLTQNVDQKGSAHEPRNKKEGLQNN